MNFWDILMILEFIRHPKRMMRFCTIVIVGAIFLAACMHTLKEGISINSDDIPMIIAVAIIMILGLVLITPKRKSNCNKNSEKK
ncbi:MAG: hypothetical protein LBP63_11315 [Prevotellaceae bacterium]|nr:hypothetical protein [Prevotellaceae bacterium]